MRRLVRFLRLLDKAARFHTDVAVKVVIVITAIMIAPVIYALRVITYSGWTKNLELLHAESVVMAIFFALPTVVGGMFIIVLVIVLVIEAIGMVWEIIDLWHESDPRKKKENES